MTEPTTETILTLTPRAAAEVKDILTKPENAGKNFRVYVEQGGCSGMQYGMVFDEPRAGDFASDQHRLHRYSNHSGAALRHLAATDLGTAAVSSGQKYVSSWA